MVLWRAVGINYVRFSQIAALTTRKCIKTDSVHGLKKAAHPASLKITQWENGKPVKKVV